MGIFEATKELLEYWPVFVGIAGFFMFFYKKELDKAEERHQLYFIKILAPFHIKMISSSDIDINDFFMDKDLNNHYVPSYIPYLLKFSNEDYLRKIMIVDYI